MWFSIRVLPLLAVLLLPGCSGQPGYRLADKENIHLINSNDNGIALNGYDPVAYFVSGEAKKGKPEYQYRWQRAEWRFHSRDNLRRFRRDPLRYRPCYNGYSPWSAAYGRQLPPPAGDPLAWRIRDGKLYLLRHRVLFPVWFVWGGRIIKRAEETWPEKRRLLAVIARRK